MSKNKQEYRIDTETGCWVWLIGCSSNGYGVKKIKGKCIAAHRYIYEKFKGAIPNGLEIDHLCRNKACVNPDHLEAVTHLVNMRRRVLNRVGRSRVCANAHKYKGVRKPTCNKGNPCQKCLEIYRKKREEVDEDE